MRVIAGQARGRALKVPREVARPTTDRVRESLFAILGGLLDGAQVLDLFAGSGALGIEALSRGAARCQFVEQNRGAAKAIRENLRKVDLSGGNVVVQDVKTYLKNERASYDLILADPPYADGLRDLAGDLVCLPGWPQRLNPDGLFILECESVGEAYQIEGLELMRAEDYGRSRLLFYQHPAS